MVRETVGISFYHDFVLVEILNRLNADDSYFQVHVAYVPFEEKR